MSCPPLFIVVDATAAGHEDAHAAGGEIAGRLRARAQAHEMFVAENGTALGGAIGRAVHAARAAGGVVVVAGGPAAFNAVAQAVWNAGLVMGALPLGRHHPVGRALGVPSQLDAAIDGLRDARIASVPVGMVADRVFLESARVGLHAGLVDESGLADHDAERFGLGPMFSVGADMLRGRSVLTLELRTQGQTRVVRTRTLVVTANRHQPQRARMAGVPGLPPDGLAAITLPPLSSTRTLWGMLRGPLDAAAPADSFRFDHLTVHPWRRSPAMVVTVDGAPCLLQAPVAIERAPRPLRWLMPATPG